MSNTRPIHPAKCIKDCGNQNPNKFEYLGEGQYRCSSCFTDFASILGGN